MRQNNEMDAMLDSFFADQTVDGGDAFVHEVMASLPKKENSAGCGTCIPLGLALALLVVWKIKMLTRDS